MFGHFCKGLHITFGSTLYESTDISKQGIQGNERDVSTANDSTIFAFGQLTTMAAILI